MEMRTGTRIRVTPAINTNAYTAGDALGGKLTLAEALPLGAEVGRIRTIVLVDQDNEKAACDILFFMADPSNSTFTNNSAVDVHDTDMLSVVGLVSIAANDYVSLADNALATKAGLDMAFKPVDGRTLYAVMITRGTPTYTAATDLQLIVTITE